MIAAGAIPRSFDTAAESRARSTRRPIKLVLAGLRGRIRAHDPR